jgi:hypothetical protein
MLMIEAAVLWKCCCMAINTPTHQQWSDADGARARAAPQGLVRIWTSRLMVSLAGHSGAITGHERETSQSLVRIFSNRHSEHAASEIESSHRQEFFFALLNLSLIGALLALQAISRFVRSRPSASVVVVLAIGFVVQAVQLTWLMRKAVSPSVA